MTIPNDNEETNRAGRGKLDTSRDCVDIVGVFTEYADVLANKHSLTKE